MRSSYSRHVGDVRRHGPPQQAGRRQRLLSLLLIALPSAAAFSCAPEPELLVPYEDPTARFPETFDYRCPDFEAQDWVCPFQDEPDDKVVFSGPREPDSSDLYDPKQFNYDLLYDTLRLIDSVPPRAKLTATTFYFTASPWAEALRSALVCAAERGVIVDVLVGNPPPSALEDEPEQESATEEQTSSLASKSMIRPSLRVHSCTGGCLRDGDEWKGRQHSKFFTASHSCNGEGWDTNVVAVSSNNWTSSLVKRDNATLIKRNDEKLHHAFSEYFNQMVTADSTGAYFRNYYDAPAEGGGFLGHGTASDENYSYHLFPRYRGADPIETILNSLYCWEGGEIRVSMSRWTVARAHLVDRLVERALAGCSVRIVIGDDATEYDLREYLASFADLELANFQFLQLPNSEYHDKYMLIDAHMEGRPERSRWTWSGSHNFSYTSLHTNEESSLSIFDSDADADGISDDGIYDSFVEHFEAQWERAGPLDALLDAEP